MVILGEKSDETYVHIKNENKKIQCGKLRLFKKGVVTRNSRSNLKNIYSNLQCAKDRLIVPSQCFQNKLVFLSLWIRVLLFPLHLVLMRTAIWFHCSLKHGKSNFLRKTDTRKPNFVLSNCWKPLVLDVLHLAISSSVNSTSTQARVVVDMSVPVATIAVTLVRCSSVGPWLLDTNGVTFWSTGCRGGLDGAIWGGNTATGFLCGFDGTYSGRDTEVHWALLFPEKSGQWGCYRNPPEMRLLLNTMLETLDPHQITVKQRALAHADGDT